MALSYIYPNSDSGSLGSVTAHGEATFYECVDDTAWDYDSNYVNFWTPAVGDYVSFGVGSAAAASPVERLSIVLHGKVNGYAAPLVKIGIKISGTWYYHPYRFKFTNFYLTFHKFVWNYNPKTGVDWTAGDIAGTSGNHVTDIRVIFDTIDGLTGNYQVQSMFIEVEHSQEYHTKSDNYAIYPESDISRVGDWEAVVVDGTILDPGLTNKSPDGPYYPGVDDYHAAIDNLTSVRHTDLVAQYDEIVFGVPSGEIPAGLNIFSVKMHVRSRTQNGYLQAYPKIKIDGVWYSGSAFTHHSYFETHTYEWTTNPATGLAWTINDINWTGGGKYIEQIKVEAKGAYAYWWEIDSVYLEVVFNLGNASVELPLFVTTTAGFGEYFGDAAVEIPFLTINTVAYGEYYGVAEMELPMFVLTGAALGALIFHEEDTELSALSNEGAADILKVYFQGETVPSSFELSVFHLNEEDKNRSIKMQDLIYEQTGPGYSRGPVPRSLAWVDVTSEEAESGIAYQYGPVQIKSTGVWDPFNAVILNRYGAIDPVLTYTLLTKAPLGHILSNTTLNFWVQLLFQIFDAPTDSAITEKGLKSIIGHYFRGAEAPTGFEIGLFHDLNMAPDKLLTTVEYETHGTGYSRQALLKNSSSWRISGSYAFSEIITFEALSVWSPFNTICLIGTGGVTPLIAYAQYEEDISMEEGDVLEITFFINLNA